MTPAPQHDLTVPAQVQGMRPDASGQSARVVPSSDLPRQPAAVQRGGLLLAVQSLLYIITIAVFIITFVAQPFRIPSESMEPSLLVGDFLLVDKQATGPPSHLHLMPSPAIHRGEIVVFHFPVDPKLHLVKRVVGLPGDLVHLRHGRVFVNGAEITEPYAIHLSRQPDLYRDDFPHLATADPDVNSRWWIQMRSLVRDGDLRVPPGSYFVLGDNRDNSDDSRYWGLVPREDIVGQPFVVYFSLRGDAGAAGSTAVASASPTGRDDGFARELRGFARWHRMLHLIR